MNRTSVAVLLALSVLALTSSAFTLREADTHSHYDMPVKSPEMMREFETLVTNMQHRRARLGLSAPFV